MALPILDGNQTATTLSTVLTSGEHIPAHTVVSLGSTAISNITSAVSGSVVSISNFPSTQTIAGTVTANVLGQHQTNEDQRPIPVDSWQTARVDTTVDLIVPVQITNDSGTLNASNPLPISGTVTANLNYIQEGFFGAYDSGSGTAINQNLVAVRGVDAATWLQDGGGNVPISGTVTANNPNGALTTRFGSVTTANTAQITSAVTNTSRKYLLAQNISAGTVTIGIGFSPTTTQGIQLPAGGGLTFDAFCPTGAVYWLGAVTGAAFTILEG